TMRHGKKLTLGILLLMLTANFGGSASIVPPKTVVKDEAAMAMLLGEHRFSLQWISWDYFGKAVVTEKDGTLYIRGEQKAKKGEDYVRREVCFSEFPKKD